MDGWLVKQALEQSIGATMGRSMMRMSMKTT